MIRVCFSHREATRERRGGSFFVENSFHLFIILFSVED